MEFPDRVLYFQLSLAQYGVQMLLKMYLALV